MAPPIPPYRHLLSGVGLSPSHEIWACLVTCFDPAFGMGVTLSRRPSKLLLLCSLGSHQEAVKKLK